jgi:hypothetical protein
MGVDWNSGSIRMHCQHLPVYPDDLFDGAVHGLDLRGGDGRAAVYI